jgi:transcriptional regulator with XRE-family HTH domain
MARPKRARKGSLKTRGREALIAKIDSGSWSQASVAKALDLAQPSVSAWCSGFSRPEPHHREALRRLLGIKPAWWMTDDEFASAYGQARTGTN